MGNVNTPQPAGSDAGAFCREAGGRAIYLRHHFLPGDIGRVIRLHGGVYGKEHGLGAVFEGYVAQTVGAFTTKEPQPTSDSWSAPTVSI
ncbi:MAG: hypothetical protein ACOCWU_05215 [Spirochaetota bacterium]